MARRYYSEINLHLVWHTKGSQPLLVGDVAKVAYSHLRERIVGTRGVILHGLGGIETHVHAAVSILPTLCISDFVGDIKGFSSHCVNQLRLSDGCFAWQAGYGVVSFGTRDLPWIMRYIETQAEHHATGGTQARLERIDSEEP